jgi:hypothetical protein
VSGEERAVVVDELGEHGRIRLCLSRELGSSPQQRLR